MDLIYAPTVNAGGTVARTPTRNSALIFLVFVMSATRNTHIPAVRIIGNPEWQFLRTLPTPHMLTHRATLSFSKDLYTAVALLLLHLHLAVTTDEIRRRTSPGVLSAVRTRVLCLACGFAFPLLRIESVRLP